MRWWASDERAILRTFEALLESVAKAGEETELERFAKTRQFCAHFATTFVVSAHPYEGTISDRQGLAAVLDGYRSSVAMVSASAAARELSLRGNGTADLFATINLDSSGGRGAGRERFRIRIAWLREESGWKIREAEILERLESSGLF